MKKLLAVLLSLFLLLVLVPRAVTNPDGSSYDPMADIDRDTTVDVQDLSRLGRAYGSTQSVPAEPGKTVVYVYQLEADPPEVENASVAIIDPEYYYQAVQVDYTNASGIAAFTLASNSDYTAIVRSGTTCNYANFTTNEFGEASIVIQVGYPKLPPHWATITIINRTSEKLWSHPLVAINIDELLSVRKNDTHIIFDRFWKSGIILENFKGIYVTGPKGPWNPPDAMLEPYPTTTPSRNYCAQIVTGIVYSEVYVVYTPDENGNASVVIYV